MNIKLFSNDRESLICTPTSNLLQYPFLLLPSISVRTKEKVSLERSKKNTQKKARPIKRTINTDQRLTGEWHVVPVVFSQRSPVYALWKTKKSDRLQGLLLLLLLKSCHPISLKVNTSTFIHSFKQLPWFKEITGSPPISCSSSGCILINLKSISIKSACKFLLTKSPQNTFTVMQQLSVATGKGLNLKVIDI